MSAPISEATVTYQLSAAGLSAAEDVFYGRGGAAERPTGQSALRAIVEAAIAAELEVGRLVRPLPACVRWTPGSDRRGNGRRLTDQAPHDGAGTNPEE